MNIVKQTTAFLVVLSIAVFFVASSTGQQVIRRSYPNGQRIYRTQPSTVYPSRPAPIYRRQYPNRIYNAPIVQGQPIQNGVIIGPAVPSPATQQTLSPQYQGQPSPPVASNTRELADKIRSLSAENKKMKASVAQNKQLKQDVQRLTDKYELALTKLLKFREAEMKTPALNPPADQGQDEKLGRLKEINQKLVLQNEAFTSTIQTLENKIADFTTEKSMLTASEADIASLRTELSATVTRLNDLGEQNKALASENKRLAQLREDAVGEKDRLAGLLQNATRENTA